MTNDAQHRAFEALVKHPRLSDLSNLARSVATTMAQTRKGDVFGSDTLRSQSEELKFPRDDAATPFGNALTVLERGPEDDAERALCCALWAHAIAEMPPRGREDEDRAATDVLWLATHSPFDATGLLDRALGDGAGELWSAIADRVRLVDDHRMTSLGRGEALMGAIALTRSASSAASRSAELLSSQVRDETVQHVLATRAPRKTETLVQGELAPAPRGPVTTTVLALSGLLLADYAVRGLLRLALAYRRPAEIVFSEEGVRIRSRLEVLGRTMHDGDMRITRSGLASAAREVRYPRLTFYAGLLALSVGSYLGMAFLVDGVRSASPSLLLAGLLVVVMGVAIDFAFSSLSLGTRGLCRIVFTPKKGRALCIAGVDVQRADTALASLRSA